MIIQNGFMEKMVLADGGVDPETGYPNADSVSYCDPIPCQYILKNNNRSILAGGEKVETVSYQVLVEEPLECIHAEQVRLTDLCGNIVGIFTVASVERLEAVAEVSITVNLARNGYQE